MYFTTNKRPPTLGRFLQVDPLADIQENQTSYQYGWNNPIRYNDPYGDCPFCVAFAVAAIGYFLAPTPVNAASNDKEGDAAKMTEARDNQGKWIVTTTTLAIAAGETVAEMAASEVVDQVSGEEPCACVDKGKSEDKRKETSREARREAMRDAGVPTSQPLIEDKETDSEDMIYLTRDGEHTVQDAKNDESHQGDPHWEVGPTKKDPSKKDGLNRSGRNNKPQMAKPKKKVYYEK
jgi:hypothetical protein